MREGSHDAADRSARTADRSAVLVGLMSGTSLDGISAAVVRFTEAGEALNHQLLAYRSVPYDANQRQRLERAMVAASPEEYARLDFDLGAWLADAAVAVIAEAGVARADIAAIASHGHTVWHDPPRATWQFGQPAVIAERTKLPVISDFRVRDVAAGGQGAPLVPIADALLFAAPSHWRALQNLGGIGNVTVVPPGGDLASVRAFDTGPGVCVIDGVVRTLRPALPYDVDGALARAGTAIESVVDALLAHPYFAAEPPKSTGRELFTGAYIADVVARCRAAKPRCADEDIVATAVLLTARSIAQSFARFVPEPVAELLLSGGGAKNPALFDAIERELARVPASAGFAGRRIATFDDVIYDGEAKEAVAFALLGWLHLARRAGNVPSATGARGPRVLGTYTPA
ncbi:MAG: anhydro-N-acetylmuramic acid kinase [Gemmatimonadetes bacterium]|nr:anhydro-N-acetylmuramic acid kinase [Gemmatimonadota bacterium]